MISRYYTISVIIYVFAALSFTLAAFSFFNDERYLTQALIHGLHLQSARALDWTGWLIMMSNIILAFIAWLKTAAEDLGRIRIIHTLPAYVAIGVLFYLEQLPGPLSSMPIRIAPNQYQLIYRDTVTPLGSYDEYVYHVSKIWLFSSCFALFSACFSFTVWRNTYVNTAPDQPAR